jgi:hypothetical protein
LAVNGKQDSHLVIWLPVVIPGWGVLKALRPLGHYSALQDSTTRKVTAYGNDPTGQISVGESEYPSTLALGEDSKPTPFV